MVYYVSGPWGYIQAWFSSKSHYRLLQMCTINLLYVKLPRKSFPLLRNTITNALQKNEPEFGLLLVPNLRQFLVAGCCNFVNKGLFDCLWFCINLEGNLGYVREKQKNSRLNWMANKLKTPLKNIISKQHGRGF